jgi:hypothetical protein
MKTAKQIKKEARQRFEKKFGVNRKNKTWYMLTPKNLKPFIDQLIDTTIKQTLRAEESILPIIKLESIKKITSYGYDRWARAERIAKENREKINEIINYLAKEIKG